MEERLRPRADDRRDPVGGRPVAVVPPDPVPGADRGLAGADVRVVAVDEEEPVLVAASGGAAGIAVDRVDEVAAVGGLEVGARVEHPHDRVRLGRVVEGRRHHRNRPELAGDPELSPTRRRVAGTEPASARRRHGGQRRHGEDERGPGHLAAGAGIIAAA